MMVTLRKLKNTVHLFLAFCANTFYKSPSRKMTIIGVTGTDGKTTTASLIYHILRTAGFKVAIISTLGVNVNGQKYETGLHTTTPSPFEVQKYLKIATNSGCSHAVIEVTSHALDQNRVWGIKFKIGVLTNVTREHLDYHKNYEKYVQAKLKLLKISDISVANNNGVWIEEVKKNVISSKLYTYSISGTDDKVLKENELSLSNMPFKIETSLIGDFNKENILAGVLTTRILGVTNSKIEQGVRSFKAPPGRQKIIESKKYGTVIIDFAHTPNAFENILSSVRKKTTGKLIHLFGSAGERDKGKRAEMGKIASFYDDVIILTAEDPRSDKVEDINSDIISGIDKRFLSKKSDIESFSDKEFYQILDRKEAIDFAISHSTKNDIVILTGKGHEKSMNLGNGEKAWDELKIVEDFLKEND